MECQDEHALLTQWTAITCHIVLILKTRLSSHVLPLKQYVKKHIQTLSKSFNHVLHTLPETNSSPMKIPIFPGKVPSKRWIFQPAMLVYRRVFPSQKKLHTPSSSFVGCLFPMVGIEGRYIHRHDGVTTKGGILRSNTCRETNRFFGSILFFNKYPVKCHCFFHMYVYVCIYIYIFYIISLAFI